MDAIGQRLIDLKYDGMWSTTRQELILLLIETHQLGSTASALPRNIFIKFSSELAKNLDEISCMTY